VQAIVPKRRGKINRHGRNLKFRYKEDPRLGSAVPLLIKSMRGALIYKAVHAAGGTATFLNFRRGRVKL